MATKLENFNMALSEVASRANVVAVNEATKEATACNLHYDNVRKTLLRAAHWGFARKQLDLVELGNAAANTSLYPWAYMYEYPADCIKMRYLLWPPQTTSSQVIPASESVGALWTPSRASPFLIATCDIGSPTPTPTKVILTNVQAAIGVYTWDCNDETLWDEGYNDAVIAGLCSKLCLPLTGNIKMKVTFEQLAMRIVNEARASDGNEAMPVSDHVPDWIMARGAPEAWANYTGPGFMYQSWDNIGWAE